MRHEIILFEYIPNQAAVVAENLHANGVKTLILEDLARVPAALKKLVSPVLVVDFGTNPENNNPLIKILVSLREAHRAPLVIIGNELEFSANFLREYFPFVEVLKYPWRGRDIIRCVESFEEQKSQLAIAQQQNQNARPSTPLTQPAPEDSLEEEIHSAYTRFDTIPELLFSELEELNLAQVRLGGEGFSKPIDLELLIGLGHLPHGGKTLQAVQSIIVDSSPWSKRHLCRIGYMSSSLSKALPVSPELGIKTGAAAMLLPAAFSDAGERYMRQNYLKKGSLELRVELSKKIKESADKIRSELGDEQTAAIIAKIGSLIGQEEVVGNDDTSVIASAIMASDLVGRICFHSGYWDPRGVYSLLRRVRAGLLTEIHPKVVGCATKFLSEAVTTSYQYAMLPKEAREGGLKIISLESNLVAGREMEVPLSALEPGMRLARALHSLDGKKILSERVVLDHDHIWRLWQLSSIRPLSKLPIIEVD